MIHRRQNTNKRDNYEDNSVTVECAECDRIEDSDHILKCNSVFCRNGKREAWRKLKRQIGPYTDERVMHNMWLRVHSYVNEHVLDHGPLYSVHKEEILEELHDLSRIWWKHMILGRISKKWASANEVALWQHGKIIKMDATTWTAMVISSL